MAERRTSRTRSADWLPWRPWPTWKREWFVEEGLQVLPAVLALEDEGEEVRLPELVRPGALEVPHRGVVRPGGGLLEPVALLPEDVGHRLGARRESGTAEEHVGDALAAPLGVRLLEHEYGAANQVGELRAAGTVHQATRAQG